MGLLIVALSCLCLFSEVVGAREDGVVVVQGSAVAAETGDTYVCATIDWWPPEKCDYGQCPWGRSSILNLDIQHPLLKKAIQAFQPLRIRVGGTLQDQVYYEEPDLGHSCKPFKKKYNELFGYQEGCLSRERWDAINVLFEETGAVVTFGLNALSGKIRGLAGAHEGSWNESNALSFINYTVSKKYPIDSWELGNELSGNGVGAKVGVQAYAKDLLKFKTMLVDLYKKQEFSPMLLAPGGFYDKAWYAELLDICGSNVITGLTHHIYNLGAGNDPHLIDRILDPSSSDSAANVFRDLQLTIRNHGPSSSAWVSEAGGAYNSGGNKVSNTFVNSFWYLNQLGMAARYNTRAYCRQTLVGGNYGLIDTGTFQPNPDYYSALLWHRLMGTKVLSVDARTSPSLRVYAHCTKKRDGVSMVFINLNTTMQFDIDVRNDLNVFLAENPDKYGDGSFIHGLRKTFSWIGRRASVGIEGREEYHLTGKDGDYQSRSILLNGSPLELTETGDIPDMKPVLASSDSAVSISPLSIAFVVFPYFDASACA